MQWIGLLVLEDADCIRLRALLDQMRFQNAGSRNVRLTLAEAIAVRELAHEYGYPSIALAQALQFELMLSQKDVIGEWVPIEEAEKSEIHRHEKNGSVAFGGRRSTIG